MRCQFRLTRVDYDEGKKIKMKDAFTAVWALLKYRLVD